MTLQELTKLFMALGVQAINSQTFANGYYYEYALETDGDGQRRVVRKMHNRMNQDVPQDVEDAVVETEEQVQECRQAFMYNFPHVFNIDGSVAIDLDKAVGEGQPETEPETVAAPEDTDEVA